MFEYGKDRIGITDEVVDQVLTAYFHRCAVGPPLCNGPLELHHIRHRSRGGSNRPENLVPLCQKHHFDEHDGRSNGWSLHSWEEEPTKLPIRAPSKKETGR